MTTQPVWPTRVQSGVDLRLPPTSLPSGTSTFQPSSIAESIRFATGLPSISSASSLRRWIEPWLWPIRTNGRPLLRCARIVAPGGEHVAISGGEIGAEILAGEGARRAPARVTWR